MSKDVLLALGGGGIRGVAHVGVIKCLVDNGYQVAGIAGSSAGGLFGGMYAAGVSIADIERAIEDYQSRPDLKRNANDAPSLIGTRGLESIISNLLGDMLIEQMPLPFAATAVDLHTGREIVLRQGPLVKAILSTIALPGIFPTQDLDRYKLIDGGITDPVPVRAARALDPTLPIVAVRLSRKPEGYDSQTKNLPFQDVLPSSLVDRLTKTRLVESLITFYQSIDVLTGKLEDVTLEVDKPDVIVAPEIGHFPPLDVVIPPDLERAGYQAMKTALPAVEQSLSLVSKVRRISRYVGSDTKKVSSTTA